MTEATYMERELRLYALAQYLLITPINEVDFAATEQALMALAREQEADHVPNPTQ